MMMRLLCLLLLINGALHAQLREFSITEMPRPEVAVVQANGQFPDDALVLVYAAIEGLEFRSSLGAIDKQSYNAAASRYELLLKPVKQMLFVAKAGFIEAKISTLNPNPKDVYYFKVEEKKAEQLADALPGKLSINSDPPGADIYLNGFKVADKTPFTFELNSGTTKVKLKKKKYEDYDTTIVIQSTKTSILAAKLNSSFLFLNVASEPAGATVRINGVELGKTPLSKEIDLSDKLQRGIKTLRIEADGYEVISEQIAFTPSTEPLERSFLFNKLKASFIITSTPAGASVYIDGTYKGITPYTGIKEYGNYEVYVQLEDFRPSEKKRLLLSQSGKQELAFSLMPLPKPGEETEAIVNEIKIGKQVWMAENLNTDHFQNGELISEAKSADEWERAGENQQPAWCYYDNDSENGVKYGRLYNWYAVVDKRGVCPTGWHVPSDDEWHALMFFLGGSNVAGGKMKAKTEWKTPNYGATNESGFNALPGGSRNGNSWGYSIVGTYTDWWSSTANASNSALTRYLYYGNGNVNRIYNDKRAGLSVRCLRD